MYVFIHTNMSVNIQVQYIDNSSASRSIPQNHHFF